LGGGKEVTIGAKNGGNKEDGTFQWRSNRAEMESPSYGCRKQCPSKKLAFRVRLKKGRGPSRRERIKGKYKMSSGTQRGVTFGP